MMRRLQRNLLLSGLLLPLAAAFGLAAAPAQAQQHPEEVKVGLIVPLSGIYARPGQVMRMGAELAIDARSPDAAAKVVKETDGGAHGVLVTAVSVPAFNQALQLVRRKGTISLTGLPPGEFATPIFDVVLKRLTLRGSIVGTRKDLAEAIGVRVARLRPRAGRARIATRARIADTGIVTAIAQMSDGSFWSDSVKGVVTLSACLEEGLI